MRTPVTAAMLSVMLLAMLAPAACIEAVGVDGITVTTVSPLSGPTTGGTVVTVFGDGFPATVDSVLFGATPAAAVNVQGPTSATVTAPAHAAGKVKITVVFGPGKRIVTEPLFTFTDAPAPTVSSIAPSSGPPFGGTQFTISGTGFSTNATVLIDGLPGQVLNVTSTSVSGLTPPGALGTHDVTVTNSDGQSATLVGGFTILGPVVISGVSPNTSPAAGGVSFGVTGTGLFNVTSVKIGGVAATSLNGNATGLSVSAVAPPGTLGAKDVIVTRADGLADTLLGGFSYITAPPFSIASLSRDATSAAGGAAVLVNGSNFASGAVVSFGGTNATSTTLVSSTQLLAVVPAHAVGIVSVSVVQVGGSTTLPNSFEFIQAPTITHVSADFENNTFGGWGPDKNGDGIIEITQDAAVSGTRSAKMSRTTASIARLTFAYSNPTNPALTSTGVYQRWYMRAPQSTLTNVLPGQIKILVSRYGSQASYSWFDFGIGNQFGANLGGNEIVALMDFNNSRLDPGGPSDSRTGVVMLADQWYEVQTWYQRSNGLGRVKLWINGKREMDISSATLGNDGAAELLLFWLGIGYTQGGTGPMIFYVDDAAAANGYIDPVPVP